MTYLSILVGISIYAVTVVVCRKIISWYYYNKNSPYASLSERPGAIEYFATFCPVINTIYCVIAIVTFFIYLALTKIKESYHGDNFFSPYFMAKCRKTSERTWEFLGYSIIKTQFDGECCFIVTPKYTCDKLGELKSLEECKKFIKKHKFEALHTGY